ncbi:chemotaxis protein CheW [Pseudobdellovibrio sp. HCB154]|uniref:hybrid sensor histidine kinase/response regulator n=1 Tax=Pseudobdellovibrio sp. HCB154 TaxID=3386277 RepID=UPI003916E468
MSNNQLDPALQELVAEIEEISARVTGLIQLSETTELNATQIDALYRDVHTLKGSCLLFGFQEMGALAHELETRMEPVRKGYVQLKAVGVDRLLKAFDLFGEFSREHMVNMTPQFKDKVQQMTSSFKNGTTQAASPTPSPATQPTPPPPVQASSPAPASSNTPPPAGADDANTTVRVPVALLDNLMAMMSEMVLVRNQVLQISNSSDDLEFLNLSQRLDVVTSELQSEVMKTRMQPIGNVLSKFQRVVRDLAKELNKKIELTLEGTETELDKSLIEAIKDPLTHIIRNACDHGLETPDERRGTGKSEMGQILVRSFHEGGQVIIQVTDNGRGLNRDKLIKKAIEKGIITQEKAAKMTDREAHELIFAAGFSTAANVTNISGRGVGMDVVKNNIEKIGGRVELKSELGKGMTLSLKIPLTLAIVPAMIIKSGEEKYAIPQVKLVELVRVENNPDSEEEKIEYIQGKPVFRLRGKLLPLVILGEVLNPENKKDQSSYNIVVLNADNRYFGLVVDEIHDTADIVVKPLSRFLKNLSVYSGATVLGDGSVSLILDVIGLAKYAQLTAARPQEEDAALQSREAISDQQEFLFCKVGAPTVHGLPLAVVHRLEEFQWADIQMAGEIPVVQYRDQLLPIMSVHEYLGYGKFDVVNLSQTYPTCKAVVIKKNTKLYALQVHEILDVISTSTNIDDAFSDRKGVLGSLLVNGEVSVIINAYECVEHLMNKMAPGQASERVPDLVSYVEEQKKFSSKPLNVKACKILLVEDSNFFKRHLTAILKKNQLHVVVANHGQEALDLLAQDNYDLVLSDIEMPVMNGLELAKAIRSQDMYNHIPLIAITTKFSEAYAQEGLEAGFNEYLEKIKETELVETLFRYLTSVKAKKQGNVAV